MADESKLVAVRFTEKQSPYNAGEVAGFTPEVAQRYVHAKLAEFYDPEKVVPVSGEEMVLSVLSEEKTLSEAEQAAAAAAPEKELQTSASGPVGHDGEQIDVMNKDDVGRGGASQENAGGPENRQPDPKTQRPVPVKSDKEKDLKAPPADKMVRGAVREK
jgi:hypothetical protein